MCGWVFVRAWCVVVVWLWWRWVARAGLRKATVKGATGNGRNRGRVDEPGYKSSRVGGRGGRILMRLSG